MFETLKPTPPDKIIELMGLFTRRPAHRQARPRRRRLQGRRRPHAGDARGQGRRGAAAGGAGRPSPTSASSATSSSSTRWRDLALGDAVPRERLAGAQTPGGTGAIRQLFELIRRANPGATVWLSDPTWPNHPAILAYLGIPAAQLPLLRRRHPRRRLRRHDGRPRPALKAGDVLLLHGCCHNPTGANLDLGAVARAHRLRARRAARCR